MYNLPLRCAKEISNLSTNIALYLFSILLFIAIFVPMLIYIILGYKEKKKEKKKKNERKTTEEKALSASQVNVVLPSQQPLLVDYFENDLFYHHPLLSLFSRYKRVMTYPLFVFDALFYKESLIEDKIKDKDRDKFVYPVKNEFAKIVISLVLSLVFIGFIRFISCEICKIKYIRRTIALSIMAMFDAFLFYYCVVFCGIYVKAQYGWLYSGIWTIFFDWVIIVPLLLLLLTFLERHCGDCLFVK